MKTLLSIVISLMCFCVHAQDVLFSQYYQAPLYLNPGFTGITPQQRLVINHRVQWPGLPQAFSTYAASYDFFAEKLRSGFGVIFTTDRMGSAGWRTTTASALYSYKIKLSEEIVFSPGISFGYGMNGLDRSKLRMSDGLAYKGVSLDPELQKLGTHSFFDFNSGFLLYSKKMWLGVTFMHMNRPNLSVVGENSRLDMKTAIHGGLRLSLDGKFRTRARTPYLTPSFIYRMQGSEFSQLDLGVNFHIDPVSVGAWYRGKPFKKNIINTVEQDALILFAGLYLKNLTIGYSYDFTISQLESHSGGAHEVSIAYQFSSKSSTNKSKYRLIPCPTFNR
jgi:type IX secretion system PorP/SprF family membrane protein